VVNFFFGKEIMVLLSEVLLHREILLRRRLGLLLKKLGFGRGGRGAKSCD
jgi:hypothetical protein